MVRIIRIFFFQVFDDYELIFLILVYPVLQGKRKKKNYPYFKYKIEAIVDDFITNVGKISLQNW